MRKFFSCLAVLLALSLAVQADNLVSARSSGTLAAPVADGRIKAAFGLPAPFKATTPVKLFKILYRSPDQKGRPVVLSGLLAWPQGGAPKGLVIYNHGTMVDDRVVPSRYTGKGESPEGELAVLAFASGGYAVAMPDYLGQGDHQGAHPYPMGAVNSRAAIDLIAPARLVARRAKVPVGAPLFVAGYSEGGAVTMWMVRQLEKQPVAGAQVTAAAPMSGPYDLSGVTRQSLLAPSSSPTLLALRLYLLAYMVHSFQQNNGARLTNYFAPAMALTVSRAFKGDLSDENIIKRLALTAALMGAKTSAQRVLTPRFYQALQSGDKNEPLIRQLIANNCYDWAPRTKMLLTSLQKDDVVAYANTQKAMQSMRARGVGANIVRQAVINQSGLNHVTGAPRAFVLARRFFDGGFVGVSN